MKGININNIKTIKIIKDNEIVSFESEWYFRDNFLRESIVILKNYKISEREYNKLKRKVRIQKDVIYLDKVDSNKEEVLFFEIRTKEEYLNPFKVYIDDEMFCRVNSLELKGLEEEIKTHTNIIYINTSVNSVTKNK